MLLFINGRWFERRLGPTKCRTGSGSILFISKYELKKFFHAHSCFTAHANYICLKDEGVCFRAPSVVLSCK